MHLENTSKRPRSLLIRIYAHVREYLGQIVHTSQFEEILQRLEDLMERLKGNDQEISKYCD